MDENTKNRNDAKTTGCLVSLMLLSAVLLMAIGLWLIFRPLALIFCGGVLLWLCICIVRTTADRTDGGGK